MIDLLATFAIYLIVSLSLNLEFGYAGVPDFGKLLSVAGGAFVVGYFPGRFAAWILGIGQDLDYIGDNSLIVSQLNLHLQNDPLFAISLLLITLLIAGLIGAALGFIASYPAIRLREEYLAMTLLAMAEAIRVIGRYHPPIVGGTLGVQVPDPFAWTGELRFVIASMFTLLVAFLVFLYLERLIRSPLGRTLRAIRDNEDVAKAYGKNVALIRMKTILVSSIIGAIGGALYAFYTCGVIAVGYDRVTWTFWPWVMVILGGTANNLGVALGTFVFVAVRKLIIFYKELLSPFIPFDVVWLDPLLLGSSLIIILMFRPEGLLPEKPTFTVKLDKSKLSTYLVKSTSDKEIK